VDDFKAWLDLPDQEPGGEPDPSHVEYFLESEKKLGDGGIAMIEASDPLCHVAPLFDMGTYTIMGMTEPELFQKALEKVMPKIFYRTEAVARALPGRLWRICGAEYATPPFLRPQHFKNYVVRYETPMVESIQKQGGFARIHCHGRLKDILDLIVSTGCSGLDPIEPPPQGNVELSYVRRKYGRQIVLFGNIEITDIENLPTVEFEQKVAKALREGTEGDGRGFVLQAGAAPYGRMVSELTLRNYEKMVEMAEKFGR